MTAATINKAIDGQPSHISNVMSMMFNLLKKQIVPRPIFVIGSYRSGTSVLTWALGQHPNIVPLEETNFIYRLAVDAESLYELGSCNGDRSFLRSAQYTGKEFRLALGRWCNDFILSSRGRIAERYMAIARRDISGISENLKFSTSMFSKPELWLDGTPENSHFVLPLLRMFPEAKFIHILRDPAKVARSLMNFSAVGQTSYAEEDAYRMWISLVRSSVIAEQAFGPDKILRINHQDLVDFPEQTIGRCLEFTGQRFSKHCLKPLQIKLNSSFPNQPRGMDLQKEIHKSEASKEARDMYERIVRGEWLVRSKVSAARGLYQALHMYRMTTNPAEHEKLGAHFMETERELFNLRARHEELARKLRTYEPTEVLGWGPNEVRAGMEFNRQPSGMNALWFQTQRAADDSMILFNGTELETAVHEGGGLVTAAVPPEITSAASNAEIFLVSKKFGENIGPFVLSILPEAEAGQGVA